MDREERIFQAGRLLGKLVELDKELYRLTQAQRGNAIWLDHYHEPWSNSLPFWEKRGVIRKALLKLFPGKMTEAHTMLYELRKRVEELEIARAGYFNVHHHPSLAGEKSAEDWATEMTTAGEMVVEMREKIMALVEKIDSLLDREETNPLSPLKLQAKQQKTGLRKPSCKKSRKNSVSKKMKKGA